MVHICYNSIIIYYIVYSRLCVTDTFPGGVKIITMVGSSSWFEAKWRCEQENNGDDDGARLLGNRLHNDLLTNSSRLRALDLKTYTIYWVGAHALNITWFGQ